ncbi:addiction module toxin RelE [Parabacteroides sp. An277]|uniref:type II toxin-antitoxin system RelE/ParE family toxin n=1 Tax=Parabacteroides sp. An277 TaxID=1965619 RepID=UPI000B37AEC8|nr:type II toxin-antitoxin system RelE/ParE family toxin [Parabacteroides sp. An277]OUO49463.1 addiction module toxin RelE [Parabacteroides sp. An277]
MKTIIAYKNYFDDFLEELSIQEERKVLTALDLLTKDEPIPTHYVKYIREGIYEFRIFFIYDGNNIVVLFNAFKKKTQRTPEREIKKAIRLKDEYYEAKRNQERHL